MESADFKKNVISGLSWTFLNQFGSQILSLGLSIVLARLIAPKEFGLIAMIAIFSNFARIFIDFGFSSALIQRKELSGNKLSTVFWFNISTGTLLCAIFYIGSDYIAQFYNNPQLAPISRILSFTFIIRAFTSIQSTLLTREMNFKRETLINWSTTILSSLVAIIMAFKGYGVWSLVVQSLLNSISTSVLYWYSSKWRPAFIFDVIEFKSLLGYGSSVAGNSIFNYWTRNMDNLLIGKMLGSAPLGIYNRAYSLMLLPVSNISGAVSKVMFPAFSSIQDDKPRIKNIYLKVTRTIAFITFPLMFGLCAVSEQFILFVYGDKWAGMIPILKILSVLGAFQSVLSLNGILYNSQGKPGFALRVTIVLNFFLIIGFYAGLKINGLVGLSWGYFIVATLGSVPILYFATKLIDTTLLDQARNLWKIFLSALIMFVVVYLIENTSLIHSLNKFQQLSILVLIGFGVYISLVVVMREKVYIELIENNVSKFWSKFRVIRRK